MLSLVIFGTFFALALAGLQLMVSLLATTVGVVIGYGMQYPLESVFLSFIGGVEPFILIAVPLFVFTGQLLAQGGVGKRIVAFANVLFGWLAGGLGVATVMSCPLFGGVSGLAIADTAAIGSLVIPAMLAKGYSRGFAAALVAVAGTLALLMPLSIPFLVYAFISGVSMRTLSMAGLLHAHRGRCGGRGLLFADFDVPVPGHDQCHRDVGNWRHRRAGLAHHGPRRGATTRQLGQLSGTREMGIPADTERGPVAAGHLHRALACAADGRSPFHPAGHGLPDGSGAYGRHHDGQPGHCPVHAAGGGTVFVAAKLANATIGEITKHLWLMMAATFSMVLVITYVPGLTTWFPRWLAGL